eukprot:6681561-Prymnesium_polylepis.1
MLPSVECGAREHAESGRGSTAPRRLPPSTALARPALGMAAPHPLVEGRPTSEGTTCHYTQRSGLPRPSWRPPHDAKTHTPSHIVRLRLAARFRVSAESRAGGMTGARGGRGAASLFAAALSCRMLSMYEFTNLLHIYSYYYSPELLLP